MTYDDAGNVQTHTDERGNIYTYGYDESGRKTSLQYPEPSKGATASIGPMTMPEIFRVTPPAPIRSPLTLTTIAIARPA